MPRSGCAPARKPTQFDDLNTVLAVLVEGIKARLGDNLIGVYLQGSFAVGDADAVSDCDFTVVIRRDLTRAEIAALDGLHAAIHELPYLPWRHRLEGSYVPADIIRRASPTPRDPPGEPRSNDWADPGLSGSPPRVYPFVYLEHGARSLTRSEHDNTQVVRWCLREKGVVLCGPDPKTLVDPVPPDALRAEVRQTMDRCIAVDLQPMDEMAIWPAFWVGLFCRILHTLETGAIASKKAGSQWAMRTLDSEWRDLIARSLAIRDGDRDMAMLPADPANVAATRAFVRYAVDYADRAEKQGPRPIRFTPPPNRPAGRGRRG